MDAYERACRENGYNIIAGIDEAGRGALAGPVVAAAVILPSVCHITDINDSKKLTSNQRSQLYEEITDIAISVGISTIDNLQIEQINILNASLRAMALAVEKLKVRPDYLLVDGNRYPDINIAGEAITKGDSLSYSIAAASIMAKVTRDRLMIAFDKTFPNYGFKDHKGYPTKKHRQAIAEHGVTDIHRKTFRLFSE